ncbi:MAG: tyrosine-type recombinase/integrase [Xanthobacteraceae bacterium]
MRKTLTDRGVAALKPRPQRYAFPDPQLTGHYVRVQPSGSKTFVTVACSRSGKQIWTTIGASDVLTIDEARERAREVIKRVRSGLPAVEPAADSFAVIAANWLQRHVEPNGLRSAKEIVRLLDRHILPAWRDREFISIRRSDVAALLDHVEDNHGARQADYCLNVVRSIANWYAARNDDYTPPIARGMRRQNPKAQARARILTDDEIRAIWKAAESNGTFGGIVRLALLTAQRRTKVVGMRWADVSVDGVWTIPKEQREKDTAGSVLLPKTALDIIRAQPRIGNNPFVFAGRGDGRFNGFSKSKERFDAKCGVTGWTLHDLRRTARSLMARAGVSSEHAERVLGHTIGGVEGVYDRHRYDTEKADALRKLAALIQRIVTGAPADIVPLRERRRG